MAACSSSYSVYAEETKAEATRVEESKEEGVRCDPSWWDMNDDDQQLRSWFDYLNNAYFGGQLKVNHINYRSGMYDPWLRLPATATNLLHSSRRFSVLRDLAVVCAKLV